MVYAETVDNRQRALKGTGARSFYWVMNNAARRIVISRPGQEDEIRFVDADGWAPDQAAAAAKGLPPFSYIVVQMPTYWRNEWRTITSLQTRPMPGWAGKGASWCAICGCVSFDGAALPCAHNTPGR